MEELKTNDSKDVSIRKIKGKIENIIGNNTNNITKDKKTNFKIILMITVSFLVLILVFISLFLVLAKNKKKELESQNLNEIEKLTKNNYIEASYKV